MPAYRALVSEGEDAGCEVAHNSPHSFLPKRGVNEQPLKRIPRWLTIDVGSSYRDLDCSLTSPTDPNASRPRCARGRDSAFDIWLTGSGISGIYVGYQATRVMGLPDGEKI